MIQFNGGAIVKHVRGMICFLAVCFGLFSPAFAGNTGKLAGTITDADTGEPLPGANVVVTARWENDQEIPLSMAAGAACNIEGNYFILNLRPGLYTVEISFVGYRPQRFTKVAINVDKTTRLDVALQPEVFQGEEIQVIAYKQAQVEKDLTATKQVYDVGEVQAIAGVADVNDILQLQADVVDDHFRGGRVGEATYLFGGGLIVNPLNNRRAFSPIVTALDQIEVYTSGFSAEYGNAQSGVVNMVPKEGGSKWQSRLEMASTLPYYKTWQGNPYDPKHLYFHALLSNLEEWMKENPTNPGKPLYDLGYGFGPIYLPLRIVWPPVFYTRDDSLKIAQLGQRAYQQGFREIGMKAPKAIDTRVDFTTGGPLTKHSTIFIAARQTTESPIVPMLNPITNRQMMMNWSYHPNFANKLKLTFLFNLDNDYVLSNFLRYMFDRSLNALYIQSLTLQYGVEWNHVFSPSTFANFRFTVLDLNSRQRIELMRPGEFYEEYSNGTNWTNYTAPSYHRIGQPSDDFGNQNTYTYNFHTSVSSQLNTHNLIKAGLQFFYYDVDVDMDMNITTKGNYRKVKFKSFPYEGALFVQDKMEFVGMIANIGLRWDFYQLNTDYYGDKYSPLRQPDFKIKTKLYSRLQPRIGISFPVSENSVFHLNYGTFTQRPNFNQLFYNQITLNQDVDVLGNPALKPETTNAYDVGLVYGLPYGFRLDVSAYYKDVKNLVESAYYKDKNFEEYRTYVNRDYADIKGFHVNLEKVGRGWQGYLRYNYESAKGKSSNALNAPVIYFENPDPTYGKVKLPDPEDVYLDYDRTHKLLLNVRYTTTQDWGLSLLGLHPFGAFTVSTTYRLMTGRPYTWDESGQGLKYNKRTPTEHEWKMRLQKKFRFRGTRMTWYLEGFNLLNEKVYNYSRTFNDERETARWEQGQDVLIYDEYAPYTTSQAIYLLRNQPRHYRMGVVFEF